MARCVPRREVSEFECSLTSLKSRRHAASTDRAWPSELNSVSLRNSSVLPGLAIERWGRPLPALQAHAY
jgi:hypothetical protein